MNETYALWHYYWHRIVPNSIQSGNTELTRCGQRIPFMPSCSARLIPAMNLLVEATEGEKPKGLCPECQSVNACV